MTLDLAFRGRRVVVDGAEAACVVGVRDGRIAVVAPFDETLEARELVALADDEVLLPGLVDTHVHVNEPGRTEWEGYASATRAAAAGGVTTIVDMPLNSIPPTTTTAALAAKRDCARAQVHVDVGFWGGAVPGNLADLAALHDAGVFGFKCFLLDSGVPEFPPLDASGFAATMAETARLGAMLIVHAEDAGVIAQAPPTAGPGYAAFLRSRPHLAEQRAIDQVIDVARATGGRAHVLHLSSAHALPGLAAARAAGVDVSVETCPHYLTLSAADVPDGATQFKCCPPIRDGGNRDRLWQALAAGDIDMVVSDHSPCTAELKLLDLGDFGRAWGGIAGLQLGLPVVWTAARSRGHSLTEVTRWMAQRPAERVGLAHKGRIAVGADADLCVLAPDAEFVVDPVRLLHRNQVTAYSGRRLVGVVRQTWLRGMRVRADGRPFGKLLTRGHR
ncbi:allantoinase AllB [Micromonospora sp. KC606]|uniref:allantoinase AllB n=1 Tax=Micromonospora sp. KC606 TaxID=2530379 RepID=UPI00104B3F47|nr:allantoinase AllB [Micromonospora sp. KC606]TDC85039.1 allantoinase AllB [Micromonospora sp. KC606]